MTRSLNSKKILQYAPYLLIGAALLAFLGYLWVYTHYAVSLFRFPFDYDQGEGFELVDTILFSQGKGPYRDINTYPFYSSNYPPVFHLVIVPLVWLFGPHYWTGRLVSFVGTLINAAAIGYVVHRQGKRWWLSIIAGLIFLSSNYVYHVGPLFRQHMFMVMFETLAVVIISIVVEREEKSGNRNNRGWLLVMFLLLLAGYTKQLAYATVAAIFIFLFLRQWKRAIGWAIPFAIMVGLVFLGINWASDGQWYVNTIVANLNEFIPQQAIGLYRQWFTLHTIITVVAALFAIYQLYFERLSVYSIWFVVAVANSVTAGTWGAGESYFATAIAASAILTGFAFNRLLDWGKERPQWGWQPAFLAIMGILLLIQADKLFHMPTHTPTLKAIAQTLGKPTETVAPPQTSCSAPRPPESIQYVDSIGYSLIGRPPTVADKNAGIQITNLIAQGNSPAFSEEAGFNLYLNRDVVTNPTQFLNLYKANQVDMTNMLNMLDQQAFDTVVLRAQFYPPPVLDMIGQRYETKHLVQMNGFVYCILLPKTFGDS